MRTKWLMCSLGALLVVGFFAYFTSIFSRLGVWPFLALSKSSWDWALVQDAFLLAFFAAGGPLAAIGPIVIVFYLFWTFGPQRGKRKSFANICRPCLGLYDWLGKWALVNSDERPECPKDVVEHARAAHARLGRLMAFGRPQQLALLLQPKARVLLLGQWPQDRGMEED